MGINLEPGMSKSRTITVDEERTISFMGDDCRVYATPSFVRDMEHLCRDFIKEHVDDGDDSVGMSVSIVHTAPTLLGMNVTLTATVESVEGRKIKISFTGQDDLDPIGKGEHDRFVVGVEQTAERLRGKRAKFEAQ